jgi:hypothetical protein
MAVIEKKGGYIGHWSELGEIIFVV